MDKIRFGLIGSGWRGEFYIRIAKALPEQFELTAVMIRDPEKGKAFSKTFGVKVVNSLEELMADAPSFVVLAIRRGCVASTLEELFEKKIPVLTETPPGETEEDLLALWDACQRHGAKVQVAEQYFLQPLYSAWLKALSDGILGDVENVTISALHGYHGISMIRKLLGIRDEKCTIYAKRYHFTVTETYGREGMVFDGETFRCPRDRATLEFENGQVAFFDFSDPAQYHSFIRTRQLGVQGTRGEIDDLTVRYLTPENIPVTQDLRRIDLGVYGNQEWSHFGLMLGEKFLYRSPFPGARFNDDEIAVASLLQGMDRYLKTGEEVYSLAQGLQDMYITLKMEEAMATPYAPVTTEPQPWSAALA